MKLLAFLVADAIFAGFFVSDAEGGYYGFATFDAVMFLGLAAATIHAAVNKMEERDSK